MLLFLAALAHRFRRYAVTIAIFYFRPITIIWKGNHPLKAVRFSNTNLPIDNVRMSLRKNDEKMTTQKKIINHQWRKFVMEFHQNSTIPQKVRKLGHFRSNNSIFPKKLEFF